MKRLMFAGLLALGLALSGQSAEAACRFNFSGGFNLSYESSGTNRTFYYSKCSNPLPPCSITSSCYRGPAMWDGYAYGAPAYGAPAYGAPAYAPPIAATPAYTAPQPTPSPKSGVSPTGLQQAGYFYYGQPTANYGYGYGNGYGYGAGYYQAPSYWYGN